MPLDRAMEQKVRAAAESRGHDPDEAVAEAEKRMASREPKGDASKPAEPGVPTNERLLPGHLPFIKVNELRTKWLGLPECEDGEMFCREFELKHGGGAATAPAAPEVAE